MESARRELREPSSSVLRGQLDDTEREVAEYHGICKMRSELRNGLALRRFTILIDYFPN